MASMSDQACYTLLADPHEGDFPNEQEIKTLLEKGTVADKRNTIKKLVHMVLSGERVGASLLMHVIRFAMPTLDHELKKLLLIFWEVVPKYTPDGKMMHEYILVCDAYRKDLQHPNEYIRGCTLRFLCKLKEPELLEPLMPTIRACLEHRHKYVRRNAVLAIFTIYRSHEVLIPDAPELIANFLEQEQDMSCKRNAFMMLIQADQERALNYLSSCMEQVQGFGDILQLVIVELIYKVCHNNPSERARFITCIYNLLQSSSPAVRYEAAGTLITLSGAPSAVKATATCYIELIVKESDNNVKLIVLDRLVAMAETHEKVLQELVMDIMRVLSATDLEVRRKTLDLALELVSSRNIDDMVLVLKKEVIKTNEAVEQEDANKYRQLLVRTLHQCSVRFPDVAPNIIPVLMEFLSDTSELASQDVLVFVREAVQRFHNLRPIVLNKMIEVFPAIKNIKIFRAALWILGEYCSTSEEIQNVMTLIRQSLGEIPIVDDELRKASGEDVASDEATMQAGSVQRMVTADGTYVSQSAFTATKEKKDVERPPLRGFLMTGNFFVGAALATVLTKLALRFPLVNPKPARHNSFKAEAMLIMASILHLGKSGLSDKSINDDDIDRVALCLNVLSDSSELMVEVFNKLCRESLDKMLSVKASEDKQKTVEKKVIKVQADDPIKFGQLAPKNELGQTADMFELTMSQALGGTEKKDTSNLAGSKLNKVTQLTGFSDPVYAEAYVHVNQYDIVLDILIVNQTSDTLQNLTVELATLGDLKLVEKPMPMTLAGNDFCNIKANVKVASTENGIIFGNIVYDVTGAASDRMCVVLNDIHIDIMDYILPASCTDAEFRQMWAEFEWENKVAVNTNIKDMYEFLEHITRITNMKSITPLTEQDQSFNRRCGFLAANLYAKSIFGEDALANVSVEKPVGTGDDVSVTGHIRIRAKSQGMALSLGDKINVSQKKSA
ncbi:coatomer subunit beta-like [Watersipora subatra]|uniref:coatomer subunit beta-like n=1 Tax=Watersipora subatra TaxID=2589382 RepID=UPI00355B2DCF